MKQSKRIRENYKSVDKNKVYEIKEAIKVLKEVPQPKFDQSVELSLKLGIDPKKTEQSVRGSVVLPYGTGKKKRVLAFCEDEKLTQEAKEAGADFVGLKDLIEKIEKGWMEFDAVLCSPNVMRQIAKLGRILGPRGLMPSPKAGTVSNEIGRAVQEIKKGKVEFKNDKDGGIHLAVGKISFSEQEIEENISCLIEAVKKKKPAGLKGHYIQSLAISSTMGPGLKITKR
ncbi:MAG: 50S ribosomal protein L1 [Candidatus Omnitrophica bacterium 4484_213]|nr:MAG: 50S ribosomal protein L1 [Candidatus Omnitrophica bacterium 4484_213]